MLLTIILGTIGDMDLNECATSSVAFDHTILLAIAHHCVCCLSVAQLHTIPDINLPS